MSNSPYKPKNEVKDEKFYCLFASDGTWQPSTLAEDFETVVGFIKLLHKKGVGKSFHQLITIEKCKILPVNISMEIIGDENEPFKTKQS